MPPTLSEPAPTRRPDAVLDASVLFQEPVRSLLLWIASAGGFAPAWSDPILVETGRNLIKREAVSEAQWSGLRAQMEFMFPDAMVDEQAIRACEKKMPNDEKDRHVLAAAVVSGSPIVITNNLKHFKAADLDTVDKKSIDADGYLCELIARIPNIVSEALANQAENMSRPRQWTTAELLGRLKGIGRGDPLTPRFATEAEQRFRIQAVAPPERPRP